MESIPPVKKAAKAAKPKVVAGLPVRSDDDEMVTIGKLRMTRKVARVYQTVVIDSGLAARIQAAAKPYVVDDRGTMRYPNGLPEEIFGKRGRK